jgi:hypothetical protein
MRMYFDLNDVFQSIRGCVSIYMRMCFNVNENVFQSIRGCVSI